MLIPGIEKALADFRRMDGETQRLRQKLDSASSDQERRALLPKFQTAAAEFEKLAKRHEHTPAQCIAMGRELEAAGNEIISLSRKIGSSFKLPD